MSEEISVGQGQTTPQDKAELLARIDQAWVELQQTIQRLSDEELASIRDEQGWAVKDHLAHITAWEQSLLALLEGRDRNAVIGLDPVQAEAGIDEINDVLYRHSRDRSPAGVIQDAQRSHDQILAVLAQLTDDDLVKPYSYFQPNDPPYNAAPVLEWINGNTHEHYREHTTWIRALLAAQQ